MKLSLLNSSETVQMSMSGGEAVSLSLKTGAVQTGGSTLRDFYAADGNAGHFQLEANVYGREGLPCKVCSTPIKMLRQGQRSTFFCPQCQKA